MTQPKNYTGQSSKKTKNKYRIRKTKMYKRQYKKLFASGQYDMQKLEYVINLLAQGKELPSKYKNHHLKGDLKNFMECHIESDWLLMYYIQKERLILLLVRTGSHNEVLQ